MTRTLFVATGLLVGSLLISLPAFAAPSVPLPPEQTQGAVSYVSGGLGKEEAQAFKAAAKQYPLSLEFGVKHAPHAEFTTNVHVMVKDAQGKSVLDTRSDGPFLLAKLPIGHYTVTAEQHGQTLTKTAEVVTHKPVHLTFLWAK
jgi:hypothetical protein